MFPGYFLNLLNCSVHVAYVRLCSCCRVRNSPALFLVESSKNNFLKKMIYFFGRGTFFSRVTKLTFPSNFVSYK